MYPLVRDSNAAKDHPLHTTHQTLCHLALALCILLPGCAAGPQLGSAEQVSAGQQLEELDCGRITGRMQVRILSLRSEGLRTQPSALSRGLNTATTAVGLSEGLGVDPGTRQARELQELERYNTRLQELGCKSYDLQKELQQTDLLVTPRPR